MKLSKLYCNKENFKNITFNLNGINVIYADVKTRESEKKNSHDLGKTLLSKIIDFLLLKEINKNHFLLKVKNAEGTASIFEEYEFFLEILLNSGKFLTVRRQVNNNTRISFKISNQRTEDYIPPQNWDQPDIPIKPAKEILSNYLGFTFFQNKDYDYRKAINYSLRMQGDYEDVYRLTKFKGRDVYWKPFMFDLLGFNGGLLHQKYENDQKKDELNKFISNLKNEYSVNVDIRDEIVARINLKKQEAEEAEGQIDKFNFYEQDKSLIKKGVDQIEVSISSLNSLAYSLEYELKRLESSIKNNFSFNLDKIKKVFDDASIFFPQQLEHDYEELIQFNTQLTKERNKLLKETISEKKEKLKQVSSDLIRLNKEKEDLLSILQDTEVFEKFKYYQKELVKIEGEFLKLREKLTAIDKILQKEEDVKELGDEIKSTVEELRDAYKKTEDNKKYSLIRKYFSSYYKEIINENAILSWKINSQNNVEFNPPKIHTTGKRETAKDEGTTYKKLLCVAFDLTILSVYNSESYYRFVYHDDVLSQQDNGIKKRLLSLIERLTKEYDLQYIFSIIKSDLPTDDDDRPIQFSGEEIVLRLHDRDGSGTLFGFEF